MEISSQTTPRLLMSLIGVLASLERTIPMGRLRMRPLQWYLKTNWQYPQSLDLKIPVSNFLKSHLQWWKDPKNLKNGLSFSSTGTQYPYFHKCIKSRLPRSFRKHDSQWQLDRSRKLLHINVLELKAVFLALKGLSKQVLDKRVLIATHYATVVSYLSKQEGTHSWDRCLLVWRILAYCNPRNILVRATHIQGCLNVIVDSLSRKDKIIQTEWSLHSQIFSLIWLSLVHTNGGHVCHQIGSQTTNLCLTSPGCKCYEHRCIEHLLGGSGRLFLLSCSTHTKSDTGNEHLQVQDDSSCTRVAQNALVLGSSESVNQTSITSISLASSVKATIQ